MPNDNTPVCGCGVVLDLPKSRNGMTAISTRNFTILIPKPSKNNDSGKIEGSRFATKKTAEPEHVTRGRGSNSRTSDSGSTSSVSEHSTRMIKNNKKDRHISASRRTRSADRAESHYTYIDSGSSIVGSGIRQNTIAEAVYCTIDSDFEEQQQQQQQQQQHHHHYHQQQQQQQPQQQHQPQQQQQTTTLAANGGGAANNTNVHLGMQNNRAQHSAYTVPSMTSPPPSYDVAIANSWQTGLPPSYEEYLCHKHVLLSRSHTPPPPWSDSSNSGPILPGAVPSLNLQQMSRELLANHPDRCVYLDQEYRRLLNQHMAFKKQATRMQRTRTMSPRSLSESRAHQQRIAMMYEDGAFCMETTAIQSAFENGVAFCSLM